MASAAQPLHWSFNYGHHHNPKSNFRAELFEQLDSWQRAKHVAPSSQSEAACFRVLPNFWDGYAKPEELRSHQSRLNLACGSLRINRSSPEASRYSYKVSYLHEVSGEEIQAHFVTTADAHRKLVERWSLQTTNHGRDLYRSVQIDGRIEASAVRLSVNSRLHFKSAELPPDEGATCNWALFDGFSDLVQDAPAKLNLLENLEKLKCGCRISYLEDHDLALSQRTLQLRGYVLHGPGTPPSYWWLNEDGQVVIMSNIFNTFVRSSSDAVGELETSDHNPSLRPTNTQSDISQARSTDRPNILFINTDQQTWDALSAHGNPHLHTPHLDRLARNGCSFMRNYCTDPVCAPARTSWATGRYSSETGIPFNGGTLHEDIPDIGQLLNAHGYYAAHAGKWHVDGRDVRQSFHSLYFGQRDISAGGGEYHDPVSTHAVLNFLSSYQEPNPFYLQIGLLNPHDICEYEHSHEYQSIPGPSELGFLTDDELPPLPSNHHYDARETTMQQVMRRGENPIIHPAISKAVKNWDPAQWRYLRWQLDRYTEQVDCEIGLILNAVEASPHRDNTLIIFSVDHGEAAGCHRLFQKFTLYEESVHTPLIVASFSGRFGITPHSRDTTHLISGVDLATTILDYAGIGPPDELRGRSIRPLIEGREIPWRDTVYIESNVWGRALVSTRYKYITEYIPQADELQSPGPDRTRLGREELYDLETDPGETCNLAQNPNQQETLQVFREQLLRMEAQLDRLSVTTPAAQRTMQTWAQRVLDQWSRAKS